MKKLATVIGTLMVLAFVLVAGVAVVAAQTEEEAPATEVETPAGPLKLRDIIDEEAIQEAMAEALGMSIEDLAAARTDGQRLPDIAAAQGVDIEDVRSAVVTVVEEMVSEAVTEGTLTQEEADHILERLESGRLFFGPGRRGRHVRHLLAEYLERETIAAVTAETLGLTVEELQTAREEGQTLAEIAEVQGVALEDVQVAVQVVYEEAVAAALEDGAITAAQAERLLEHEIGQGGFGLCPGGFDSDSENSSDATDTSNALDA